MQTTQDTTTPTKRRRLTPDERTARAAAKKQKRILGLITRAVKTGDRANTLYGKKRQLIAEASKAGLNLNEPVEVNGERFALVEPDGKWVPFSDLELKKLAKNPRE